MHKSYLLFLILLCLSGFGVVYAQDTESGVAPGRYEVKSIDFDHVDSQTYKAKKLMALVGFKKGESVDAIRVDFGREDLENFYKKNGFAFVKIDFDPDKLSSGQVSYNIEEGPRVIVSSIKFKGNKSIKSKSLKLSIKIDKKRWFLFAGRYSEERMRTDASKIEDVYHRNGYLDCTVTARSEFTANGKKARVVFMIDEGPIYIVDELLFTGTNKIYTVVDNFDKAVLRDRLKLGVGEVYRIRAGESDRKDLLGLYREYGFVDAVVSMHVDRRTGNEQGKGAVSIEFSVSEGDQFRIGRIDITGNKKTQDKVVRRVLDEYEFQPGNWYNRDVARGDDSGALETKIRRMAFMKDVAITSLPGSTEDQKNVEVHVEEGQTGSVMFGAGIGSDSGFMGQIVYNQRNFDISDWPEDIGDFFSGQSFKGAGQSLRISLQPGTEFSEYMIDFGEPYYKDKPISFNALGSSWERFREDYDDEDIYDERRTKGSFGFNERFEQRYSGQWRRGIGFRAEDVSINDIDPNTPKEIKDVEGGNLLFGLRLSIGKEDVDNQYNPHSGYRLNTSFEQVTGDHTFGILSGTLTRYRTVYEDLAERKTVLATKIHGATILGDAPMFEKFYAGGMSSMRGFDYRGISTLGVPEAGGVPIPGAELKDPIGSDWLFLANTELIVPLVGESFSWLVFVDSGAIDSGSYRASVGTGIQLLIPQWFGPVPMRFEIAEPFMKDDSDETKAFSFSIGRLF
jgi:outer membrane protein assembly complex protein YaeT